MLITTLTLTAVAFIAATPLQVVPLPQQPGGDAIFETDETIAPQRPQIRPRVLPKANHLLPGTPNDADIILPPLAPEDVVGAGNTNPMINGRVYEWSANSTTDGEWIELPDGARLWTLMVASPNAAGLRLRFDPSIPARGTRLIAYNPATPNEALGPFAGRAESSERSFWTPRIFGNCARVEWHVPPEMAASGGFGAINLTGIVQIFPDPPEADMRGGCRLDVTCQSAWQTTAQSVAHYDFVQGGDSFICSGAMVTRLPSADLGPLFLTAAHCIETSASAASMNIYWFFQTSTCDGAAPPLSSLPRTDGAVLLRRDTDSDICLLGLPPTDVPGGITYAGWSSGTAPDPTPATLIHHPLGMRKSWSPGDLLGIEDVSQCLGTASDTYDFELVTGGQDGGSSGAPVFDNANHRIRAVATCSESDACIPAEDTGEGALSYGYSTISNFMDASADVWVQSGWPGAENGSSAAPFDQLIEGFYAVHGGGRLHLRPGSGYPGSFFFSGSRSMMLVAEGGIVRLGQ